MKNELESIPGVGSNMAEHLIWLGYPTIASLKDADLEEMYVRECAESGMMLDRCVLYVYRCAVYYASNESHDPEKLKWCIGKTDYRGLG